MAFNLDAAIRIVAQVRGLSDFKGLSDSLANIEQTSQDSRSSLQQLATETTRLANESIRTAGGVRAQSASLQDLSNKSRLSANELRNNTTETRSLGSALQQLRSQANGATDGITRSGQNATQSIRGLSEALTLTDDQLANVRNEILQLGENTKLTERSIAQQIEVFKNLRSHAELNGRLYRELTSDIDLLRNATQRLDGAGSVASNGLKRVTNAAKENKTAILSQVEMLERLQRRLVQGGEGYIAMGRQIDALKAKAASLDLSKVGMPNVSSVGSSAVGALRQIVDLRQELAKSSPGRVVLAGEGLAAAGVAGVTGAGIASGLGGLGGGLGGISSQLDVIASKAAALPGVLKPLGGLLAGPAGAAGEAIANWSSGLVAAQSKLAALSVPFEGIATAIQAIGPGTAAAAGVASLAIASVYDVLKKRADEAQQDLEQSFRGITNEVQQALQQMTRLFDQLPSARLAAQQELRQRNITRLGEVQPGTIEARRAANAVAVAEREIAKIQNEQNNLLDAARNKEQQRANAAQNVLEQERQINAERAKGVNLVLQQSMVWRQQRIDREQSAAQELQSAELRRRASEAFSRPAILALPAAGQTSAPGTGRAISGGARRLTGQVETTFGEFQFRNPRAQAFMRRDRLPSTDVGVAPSVGFSAQSREALNARTQATDRARKSLRDLFIEINKAEQASNGSINSLQRQRAAWQALNNAVNPAAPAYANARKQVALLDRQIQSLTQTKQKDIQVDRTRGIGREAIGSALGTLAMGGGAQGAIGALAGGLAFGGGAAGLAAAAGVSVVGAAGALAARVGVDAERAEVRLKALTDQFGEYNEAQAAAARIAKTLRISQIEAADSLSQLYASLRPTGITLKEIEDALIGFNAAARVSGSTAVEASAAMLQLRQALSSGVLQGEELRSVREQAPLAAQAIAREMGVTIGELKKLGAEGKITTDIVLRALAKLKDQNLDKLNKQFDTASQALIDLRNATQDFGITLSKVFGPTVVANIRSFTEALRGVNVVTGALTGSVDALGQIESMRRAREQAQRETDQRPFSPFDTRGKQAFFEQRTQQLFQQFEQQRKAAAARSDADASQREQRRRAAEERAAGRRAAASAAAEAKDKERKKQADERAKREEAAADAASRMNQLLQENLRLNTDLGKVGKDRISQINAEIDLIPQLLRLELQDINLKLKGKERDAARINTIMTARTRSLQLEEELKNAGKEIDDTTTAAINLRVSVLSGLVPKASPLQEANKNVKQELLDADKAAADLLDRLNKLGGTNPQTKAARGAIGDLRGDLAAADPNAIASQRLVQPDVDALREQIRELQRGGVELSTLDQLVIKYGEDWDKIDPKVRAPLESLANQADSLKRNVEATREWIDVLNQAGSTIGGVLTELITGTDDWRSSLSNALKSLANIALQAALMGLAGKDGIGLFSFLTGTLGKKQAMGGVWENGIQAFARGGIVNRPTLMPLAGEAGPEAIMPLRRLPSGRLGVEAAGGGAGAGTVNNVVVNVDATGSQVQGDQQQGAALGRVISVAVQAELVRQQRPGGLLAGTR